MRQLSLSLLIAILVLLLTGSEGWKALHSLPTARVSTKSLLQRNDLLNSNSVMSVKPSVLFATASPSTSTVGRNPLISLLQTVRAKFRSFVALIVRRFRYLMMTFVLSLSMIIGGSLSMARARESAAPSPAFSVVAARSGTQPQLHRMKEMKKSRMQRQQQQKQQQKAYSSNQKKAQTSAVVKSAPNNNNKANQKTSPPPTTTTKTNTNTKTTPQKTAAVVKDNNKAVTETQATSGDGFVVSKEFYDKIGIAAVAASLIPLLISFQKDKDTSIPANKGKGKQLSATSATKKTAAPRPLTSSQRVTRAKEDEEGEENDDDDDNDESDMDYIDKQTQKTLSVKDYLDKKRQEESDETSSERMVNPYLRSKLSPGSKGRANEVSQSFEEFVEENPDVEGMVKEGVRAMRSSQQRTNTNTAPPNASPNTPNSLKRMRARESEKEEKKQSNTVEKEEVKVEEVEDIPLPYAAVIAAPEESIIPDTPSPSSDSSASSTTTATTKIAPPPPPPKKSGNFLTRLFQKPGAGRPSDLRSALLREKDDTTSLRLIIGRGLMQYVRPELGRRIAKDFPALTENFPPESNDVVLQEVEAVAEELGLAAADTAEIFAEVTNAFVVQLVDRAVSALDTDDADSDNDSDDVDSEVVAARQRERVVRRLDELTDFMNDVTPLFLAVVKNTASVEPLQYNGKASRQRLEQLFELYLREAQGLAKQSFSFPLMGDQAAEDDVSKPSAEELERLINERNDRLAKVQFLLAIKENKRTSLEQKLMKEEIAAMSKSFGGLGGGEGGSGGGGGLGDLLGGLGGLGGGKGGFPGLGEKEMKEMNELMKNMKPEQLEEAMKNIKPEQLEEAMGLLQSKGMPDLSKMKPDELAGVVKREVKSVRMI